LLRDHSAPPPRRVHRRRRRACGVAGPSHSRARLPGIPPRPDHGRSGARTDRVHRVSASGMANVATGRTGLKALRGVAVALGVLTVAACSSGPDNHQVSLPLPKSAPAASTQTAAQREHARILASYGGQYDDARIQALVEKTIGRLVAASERPDLTYKVTILNSPAINAFALPNGQLYVTRGLIALANDEAELASVRAHEMGHVIARHAA